MKLEHEYINNNGRIYKEEDIKNIQNRIKEIGTFYGSLYYPNKVENVVSHQIDNLELFDDGLYADINILNTMGGKMIKQGLKDEEPLGFSARFMNGKLISIDAVMGDKIYFRRMKLEKIMKNIKSK